MKTVFDYTYEIKRMSEESNIVLGNAFFDHTAKTLLIELGFNVNTFTLNEDMIRAVIDAKHLTIRAENILSNYTTDETLISTCVHFVPNVTAVKNFDAELPEDWEYNRASVNTMCTNPAMTAGAKCVPCNHFYQGFTTCSMFTRSSWHSIANVYSDTDEVIASLERKYRHLRVPIYRVVEGETITDYNSLQAAEDSIKAIASKNNMDVCPVIQKRLGFFTKVLADAIVHS